MIRDMTKETSLKNRIEDLKEKLNNELDTATKVNSKKILNISRQLDSLILRYYNLDKKTN